MSPSSSEKRAISSMGELGNVKRDFDVKSVESREHQLIAALVACHGDEELPLPFIQFSHPRPAV